MQYSILLLTKILSELTNTFSFRNLALGTGLSMDTLPIRGAWVGLTIICDAGKGVWVACTTSSRSAWSSCKKEMNLMLGH